MKPRFQILSSVSLVIVVINGIWSTFSDGCGGIDSLSNVLEVSIESSKRRQCKFKIHVWHCTHSSWTTEYPTDRSRVGSFDSRVSLRSWMFPTDHGYRQIQHRSTQVIISTKVVCCCWLFCCFRPHFIDVCKPKDFDSLCARNDHSYIEDFM